MTIRKQNRCPACGNVVELPSMVYSSTAQAFVCPACLRAGTRPRVDEPAPAVLQRATPPTTLPVAPTPAAEPDDLLSSMESIAGPPAGEVPPPPSSSIGPAGADFAFEPPPAAPPSLAAIVPARPAPRKPAALPSWALPAGGLVAAAALITVLAIVFVSRSGPAVDPRRAWEEANRERILALKSQAEELTIANKLPEAHAKYRELEHLVGGQQIGDPRLFDLVDQARLDQSRVYRMIMHAMDPAAVDAGPAPSAVEATSAAAARPAPGKPTLTRPPQPAAATSPVRQVQTNSPAAAPASPPAATAPLPATDVAAAAATSPVDAVATEAAPEAPPHPGPRSYNPVTDAQVEQAIRRGVDFLIAHFRDGQLAAGNGKSELERQGTQALAVYALLQSSQAIRDERLGIKGEFLARALEQLKQFELRADGSAVPPCTYARSLRASALATYNRPEDRGVLQDDVTWLIGAATEGTYTYDDSFAAPPPRRGPLPPPARTPSSAEPATPLAPRDAGAPGAPDERSSTNRPTVHRLDLAALRPPPLILAHNGEVMMPPIPPLPPPPPYVPDRYKQAPTYQLPRPGYRGSLKPPTTTVPWDNSNSQYGVLGVWAGAEVGIEVPQQYWKDVQQHWQRAQHPSGQWSYAPSFEASYSMTVGGVATLLIAHDYLEAPMLGGKTAGRKPYDDFLTAGLAFLEHGDNVMDLLQNPRGTMLMASYNLFGLERVGLASGLKYIGAHDWYAQLGAQLIRQQRQDGSWLLVTEGDRVLPGGQTIETRPDAVIDTAFVLLFLARGRHPVIMNKLRFDGFWTNRPRDAANLAAYASREMERPVNWQVVDVNRTADDWADAPILYLASHTAPKLGAEDVRKIREFVEAGGLLFTHADTGADAFNAWAAKLAKEIFPGQALENLSPQHPLYSLNYKLENPRPRLQAVDNGVRLLMIHSPTDLSSAWQVRATESRKPPFQLAVNLYLYATGKERFRNRLDTRAVPGPPNAPAPQLDIAQVQYDGNWNPEPGAWPRFVKSFQNNTGTRIVVHAVAAQQLDTSKHIMAVLSGAGPRVPDDEALAPTAKFVRDGGTLFVDACGGSGAFANAIEQWLARLDPAVKLEPMPADDVFLKASAEGATDLGPERLRLFAIEQLGPNGTRLKTAKLGKGRVIFTPLDYTSGLLGTNTWGILGYLPEYSEALATNVVLVTSKLAKDLPSAPPSQQPQP